MEYAAIQFGMGIFGAIAAVLWYLLRQKDAAQEKKIDLLFTKHDDDAQRLAELELKIAANHYIKPELDAKFDRLERSIREGMHELGGKFDRLSEALIQERHPK